MRSCALANLQISYFQSLHAIRMNSKKQLIIPHDFKGCNKYTAVQARTCLRHAWRHGRYMPQLVRCRRRNTSLQFCSTISKVLLAIYPKGITNVSVSKLNRLKALFSSWRLFPPSQPFRISGLPQNCCLIMNWRNGFSRP